MEHAGLGLGDQRPGGPLRPKAFRIALLISSLASTIAAPTGTAFAQSSSGPQATVAPHRPKPHVDAPTITTVVPNTSIDPGKTVLAIFGSHLQDPSTVDVGPQSAPILSIDPAGAELLVVAPLIGSGVEEVSVTTPGGTSGATLGATVTYPGTTATAAPAVRRSTGLHPRPHSLESSFTWGLVNNPWSANSGYFLASVGCVSVKNCSAVGGYSNPSPYTAEGGTAYSTDGGKTWATTPLAGPGSNSILFLSQESCVTGSGAKLCAAGGTAAVPNNPSAGSVATLATSGNGGAGWSVQSLQSLLPLAPPGGSEESFVTALSCSQDSATVGCVGYVGFEAITSGQAALAFIGGEFITSSDGSSWNYTDRTESTGTGFGQEVFDMSCSSPTNCIGLGDASSMNAVAFVTSDGGQTWTTVTIMVNPLYDLRLVSCSEPTRCFAMTEGSGTTGGGQVFTTSNGGATWSSTGQVGANTFFPFSTSCAPGSPMCVAAGLSYTGTNFHAAVSASDDFGAHWTWPSLVGPDTTVATYLTSVSCPTATSCVALGGAGSSEFVVIGTSGHPTHNEQCRRGPDPVDCASGAFVHSESDLTLPERGIPLSFSRTYNSLLSQTDGPLGWGWSSSFVRSLSVDPLTGIVTVSSDDGDPYDAYSFTPNLQGGYSAEQGVFASLVQESTGGWIFTLDGKTRYTFNSAGQLVSESDANGNTLTVSYNSSGGLASVTDAEGRSLTCGYNAAGELTSVTDPSGRRVVYGYDTAGDLTSAVNAAGGSTTYTYDTNHDLTSLTAPDGEVTTNTYGATTLASDPPGSLPVVSQKDAMGQVTTFSYSGDNFSQLGGTTTITDPEGNVEVESFVNGNPVSVTSAFGTPAASTSTSSYDAGNEVTSSINANGQTTTYTDDGKGHVLTQYAPLNRVTNYTYDSLGDVTSSTDPAGETTTYTYSSTGDLLTISKPDGSAGNAVTSYAYQDAASPGLPTAITDPDGHVTTYTYDSFGDLVTVTDPEGHTTHYGYNAIGEKTSTTSPDGQVTSYSYDPLGNLVSTTDPNGHVTSSVYDTESRLISRTDASGHTTSYLYNGDGERIRVTQPDGSTISYGYDANGNETSYTDANGHTTTYAYDALGRVISSTNPLGHTTTYAYDALGNEMSQTSPNGVTTSYSYDAADETTGISYSDGVTPPVALSYDSDGRRISMSVGSGLTTYTYDPLGRMTAMGHFSQPSVTQVTPASGGTAGGYQVTVSGTNFIGAGSVVFGSTPTTSFTVESPTTLTVTVPASQSGTGPVDVRVVTPGGLSVVTSADVFTYLPPATATFSATPSPAVATQNVIFTPSTTFPAGDSLSYSWSFGDGATATVASPTHAYTQAGTYTVSLTVTDVAGLGPATATAKILVAPAPTAQISVSPNPAVAVNPATFSVATENYPAGDSLSYAWNFGDGSTGSGPSPTHTFAIAGSYLVTVTVTDSMGLAPVVATAKILVAPAPTAQISVSPNPAVAVNPATFSVATENYPAGDSLSYAWNFGDGSTGSGSSPTHTFEVAGSYLVTVTVTDSMGLAPVVATWSVTVIAPPCTSPMLYFPGEGPAPATGPSGDLQSTVPGKTLADPLSVYLYCADASGNEAPAPAGEEVVFAVIALGPGGPSGSFAGGQMSAVETTGVNGLATSPQVSANAIPGAWMAAAIAISPTTHEIGAFLPYAETNQGCPTDGYTLGYLPAGPLASGSLQVAQVGTAFYEPLAVQFVACTPGAVLPSSVAFMAMDQSPTQPGGSLAGGTLQNGIDVYQAAVQASGVAVSSVVTADGVAGEWPAVAAMDANGDVVPFALTNSLTPVAPPVPTVTAVSPSEGSTAGGTTITLTGTALYGATAITLGGHQATNVDVISPVEITASTPPGSAGTVDVVVTTAGGSSAISSADHFTYVAPPAITAVTPTTVSTQGGTIVTVSGTALTGATRVTFGSVSATTFAVVSDTTIVATAPPESPGTINISVTTAFGTSAISAVDQVIYTPVAVTGVEPGVGPLSGKLIVTISGFGFTGATKVFFGVSKAKSFTVVSDTEITATPRESKAGTVDVMVTGPAGTSPTVAVDRFTFVAKPEVTVLAPTNGPTGGGTVVTITGTGLSGATSVLFGSTPAASFAVDSPSQITAVSPAETAGTAHVTVTTPGGTSTNSQADRFTFVVAPSVTSLETTAGPVGGGTAVTIAGTDLDGATQVEFGAVPATTFQVTGSSRITATAPAQQSGAVLVTVTTPGGTSPASPAATFTYVPVPTVVSVSPTTGPVNGGTTVTISGSNFSGATDVEFGTVDAHSFAVVSPTQITATSPAGRPASVVNVRVVTAGGTSAATSSDQFSFLLPPPESPAGAHNPRQPVAHVPNNPTPLTRPSRVPKHPMPHNVSPWNSSSWVASYKYDLAGNVNSITYPDNHSVSYAYNADSKVNSVTDWQSNTTSFSYDGNGNLTQETYPNGIASSLSYDPSGALMAISDAGGTQLLATYSYTRTSENLVSSAAASGSGTPNTSSTYTYLPTNELASVNSQNYGYDPAGNMTSMPGGISSIYNSADELTTLTSPSSTTQFGYDNNGNRVSAQPSGASSGTYSYDAGNRLTSINGPVTSASYTYNGDGLRMASTTNGMTANYAWNTVSSVPQLLSDGTNDYVYGPGQVPIEQVNQSTGSATYLYTDQLGSVVMEADQSGNVTGTQSYAPYGSVASSTGIDPTPFGFAGGYTDSTGLIYLINRYYHPATGQFLSVDPAVQDTQLPYSYAAGNPLNANDPLGLMSCAPSFSSSSPPTGTTIPGCPPAGQALIDSVDWSWVYTGISNPCQGWVLTVRRSPLGHLSDLVLGNVQAEQAWNEVVSLANEKAPSAATQASAPLPVADTPTLHDQFLCHWNLLYTPGAKDTFDLESWHKDPGTSTWNDFKYHCSDLGYPV